MGNTTSRKSVASDSKIACKNDCHRRHHQPHGTVKSGSTGSGKKGNKFLRVIPGIRRNNSHMALNGNSEMMQNYANRNTDYMNASVGEHSQPLSSNFIYYGDCAYCVAHALLDNNYIPGHSQQMYIHVRCHTVSYDSTNGMLRSHNECGLMGRDNPCVFMTRSDSDRQNTSTSSSSVSIVPTKYVWQNGRRMLNDDMANYLWPTDLDESDRLNTQHNIIRYVLRRVFLSPVTDPKRVLDVGCGTGMWMKEVAREFPKATLIGVDIADMFMQTDIPSNCSFELGNILEGLAFSPNRFDFVHQRLMSGAIPAVLWQAHVAELYRVTQSGGFLELVDTDFNFQNVSDIGYRVNQIIDDCFKYRGLDLSVIRRLDKLMKRAGFVEIQVRIVEFPVGEWAGVSGRMMRNNINDVLRNLRRLAVTIGVVSSEEEYDRLLDDLWKECDEHQTLVHAYYAYGQKP